MRERTIYYSAQDMCVQGEHRGFHQLHQKALCVNQHYAIFVSDVIDSGEAGMLWDELHLDIDKNLDVKIHIWIFDGDDQKQMLMEFSLDDRFYAILHQGFDLHGRSALLYARTPQPYGQYLCFALEIHDPNIKDHIFTGYQVSFPKYDFSEYLPVIYQNNMDLEAYLAIFKDMYLSIEEKVDTFELELQMDTMSGSHVDEVLCWFGFQRFIPYLKETKKRIFLHEYFRILQYKGTTLYYQNLLNILFDWDACIIEQGQIYSFFGVNLNNTQLYRIESVLTMEVPYCYNFSIHQQQGLFLNQNCYLSYNSSLDEVEYANLPCVLNQDILS